MKFHQHMCQHQKVTVYKFLWQHLIMTAVPQESDLSKLELAQAELKRLEEENASLREAKFGLERFYSDDNSDAETGGKFRKSEKNSPKSRNLSMIDEFFVFYAWKFAPVTFKECGE